jgi:hypothetical protein
VSAGNVTSASGAAPPVVVLGLVAFGRFAGRELPYFNPAGRAPSQCSHVTVSHAIHGNQPDPVRAIGAGPQGGRFGVTDLGYSLVRELIFTG